VGKVTDEKDQEKPEEKTNANGGGNDQGQQFTQEQLNAIVKDRLERATAKTTSDLMAQLGIENIDEAKQAIEDAAKAKQAQMTELEKIQAQIADAESRAVQAEEAQAKIQAQANEALLKAAVMTKATNFNDPMDAWAFVDRSKIKVNDSGAYDGIDEALKEVAETKPYLVKADNGKGPGTPTRATPKTIAERLLESNQPEGNVKRPSIIKF
jgi:hypothetical protein